jgi:hypothetical protein
LASSARWLGAGVWLSLNRPIIRVWSTSVNGEFAVTETLIEV